MSRPGQVQRLARRGLPPPEATGHVQSLGPEPSRSHLLIDEDRVTIKVHGDEAGRPHCALVRLLLQLHPLCLQPALQIADVERFSRLATRYSLL